MPKTYIDFETKKTIHFNITREAHAKVRIECFKHKLSMQEVYEEISQRIASESSEMISLLQDLSQKKRDRVIRKLSETDAESLYNIIEQQNPLSGD